MALEIQALNARIADWFALLLDERCDCHAGDNLPDTGVAVDMLASASRIFVCARGRCDFVCQLLAARLRETGLAIEVADDAVMPQFAAGDVLVAMYEDSTDAFLLHAALEARIAGACLLMVTQNCQCALARFADAALIVPSGCKGSRPHTGECPAKMVHFDKSLIEVFDQIYQRLTRLRLPDMPLQRPFLAQIPT